MPPASRVSHVPRHSAFRLAVPIGAALAGVCGASLWAQTTPAPPSGLRPTIDDTAQDAARKKKAPGPQQPRPGVIPKFGNPPGWGAGSTGFNSKNVPIPRVRSPDGGAGPDANTTEPAAKAAKKPLGLAPPPARPTAARRGRPQAAAAAAPPRPLTPPNAAAPLSAVTTPGAAAAPEVAGVVPPSDSIVLPIPPALQPRPLPVAPGDDPFGPTGVRVGTFVVRPALELMAGYDTNPARSTINPPPNGSPAFTVSPELLASSDWERHQLDITIRGAYYYFPDVRFADRPNLDARAVGRIDVSKDTRIDLEGRLVVATDYPGSPNVAVADLARLPIYTDVGATLGVGERFNRFDISLKGTIDRIQWEDSTFTDGSQESNADRNYDQYGAQLRGSYEIASGVKPFAEVDVDTRDHDLKIDRTGVDRDSDGLAVKTGTAVEFARTLTGEISVGYLERYYVDPILPNIHAGSLDGTLIWTVNGLTTVKYTGKTTIDESVLAGVSGVLRHDNGIEVSHALRRWLVTTARFNYGVDDYVGSTRVDHRYLASLAIAYKLSREFWLKGELREEWLSSNVPLSNYAATVALIGVRLQR